MTMEAINNAIETVVGYNAYFARDLDDMREAVHTLDDDQALAYIRSLINDVLHCPHLGWYAQCLAIAQATAAQHAEAFLRALGKWTTT